MVRRNKLKRDQAIPAAIMKLENGKWVVYWVFEVPVVEWCFLWLVEKSTARHAVMTNKLEFHTDTDVEGSVFAVLKNLHNSK